MGRKNKLTKKQEKFVQYLLQGKSQREAYQRAYDAKNMSNKSIDVEACRLLKHPKVSLRLGELRAKVLKRTTEEAVMTAAETVRGIARIAKDDISNYLDFRTEKVFIGYEKDDAGEEFPVYAYRQVVEMKDSRKIDTRNIQEVSIGADGQMKFKLYSKDKAWFKLADMLGITELDKEKLKLAADKFEFEKERAEKDDW